MNSTATFPTIEKPFEVTAPGGKLHLLIMDAKDGLPAAFALMGTRAENKVAIRISGGCKGMGPDDKTAMLEYFAAAFQGYRGLVWSGATRAISKDGSVDPMVTEVPGVIAQANPGCIALGTAPRTDLLTLQDDSRLVLDEWNVPNPSMSGILIVQNGADGPSNWDGDVNAAFGLMNNWQKYANFSALGFIGWNGGPITEAEIIRSANAGYVTVIVEGTGRAADDIAKVIRGGDGTYGGKVPDGSIKLVSRENPGELREVLTAGGFL